MSDPDKRRPEHPSRTSREAREGAGPRAKAEAASSEKTTDAADVTRDLSPGNGGVDEGTETAPLGETHGGAHAEPTDKRIPSDLPTIPGYVTEKLIASGGMGFVIRARDEVLQRKVAIKLPLRSSMEDRKHRSRFFREARAAAGLQHPNICPIFDVGETEDRPYLVMGYIDGLRIDQWVESSQPNARQIADVVARLAEAVHYAHQHDVLHRDIKPSNVMLDHEREQPFLMDFGLAKETTSKDSIETQDGQVLGTPSFMAPEQARGKIDEIGPATDTYSLGALLYALLCGRPPFSGSLTSVLMQVQSDEPPSVRSLVPQVHRDLETICQKAMAKEAPNPESLERAKKLSQLRELVIGGCSLEELPAWPRPLQLLTIGWAHIPLQPQWLDAFRQAAPNRLRLVSGAKLTDASWDALESADYVRRLDLVDLDVDAERLAQLRAKRPELIIHISPPPKQAASKE